MLASIDANKVKLEQLSYETKSQTEQLKELRIQLGSVNQRMEQKASYQNVKNLEQQLDNYVKLTSFHYLEDVVDEKAAAADFKRLNSDFSRHQLEFEDLKARLLGTVQVQSKLQDNTKEIQAMIDHKFKIMDDELQRNAIDYIKRQNIVRDQMAEMQKDFDMRLIDYTQQIQDKATVQDITTLRGEMQSFATLTGLRELRREVVPDVKNMIIKVNGYQEENEQMKEMIRRFDEVISDKASKMALKELQYDFDGKFVQVRHWDKL